MIKKIILWILVISCMITIFAFSSQEADTSGKTSSSFIEAFIRFFDTDNSLSLQQMEKIVADMTHIVRKCAHFSVYALLGFLIAMLLSQYKIQGIRQLIFSVIWAFLYACSDEFHQTLVKGRSGELRDVVIDTTGALCGALLVILLTALVKRIHKRRVANGFFKKV